MFYLANQLLGVNQKYAQDQLKYYAVCVFATGLSHYHIDC